MATSNLLTGNIGEPKRERSYFLTGHRHRHLFFR